MYLQVLIQGNLSSENFEVLPKFIFNKPANGQSAGKIVNFIYEVHDILRDYTLDIFKSIIGVDDLKTMI